jgi:hypothetical protein
MNKLKKRIILLLIMIVVLSILAGNASAIEIIYEKVSTAFSEPAIMIFIGIGLIGLSIIGRRKLPAEK